VREAVLPRSKMWTLPHYPELPTHTWGLLSGKRENITLHPLHPSTPLDHATLPTPYRYPAQANQGWLRLVLAIRLPLDAPGYTRCACALPCLALGIAPPARAPDASFSWSGQDQFAPGPFPEAKAEWWHGLKPRPTV
jgi:hypothetical protein